jgi:hypothetical protein
MYTACSYSVSKLVDKSRNNKIVDDYMSNSSAYEILASFPGLPPSVKILMCDIRVAERYYVNHDGKSLQLMSLL